MVSSFKRFISQMFLGATDRAARLALDANARLAMPPRVLEDELPMPSSPFGSSAQARRDALVVIDGGLSPPNSVPSPPPGPRDRLRKAL